MGMLRYIQLAVDEFSNMIFYFYRQGNKKFLMDKFADDGYFFLYIFWGRYVHVTRQQGSIALVDWNPSNLIKQQQVRLQ